MSAVVTVEQQHTALPAEFLEWQVALRRYTVHERGGHPHIGVAPLLTVEHPGAALGVMTHSIICGLLPSAALLEAKTRAFREVHEQAARDGRPAFQGGIDLLKSYYERAADFDPYSITTLLDGDSPAVQGLRMDPRCSLLFYVFNLERKADLERFRCMQIDCTAEILTAGPVFDNVWWHNTLFHGQAESSVVVHFRHLQSYETRFGSMQPLS